MLLKSVFLFFILFNFKIKCLFARTNNPKLLFGSSIVNTLKSQNEGAL